VRRGLAPVLEGARIVKASVNRPDLRWPFPDRMAARLTGATVTALRRRSKYILADLDTGETLLIHLGMSGRMLISAEHKLPGIISPGHPPAEKHDHVVLETDAGARVTFNDARRFGAMDLMQTATQDSHWLIRDLGPEPLGNTFNEAHLVAAFKNKRAPVKSALLDQRIVAGLGNIYVCEALFSAHISPLRLSNTLSEEECELLSAEIKTTLALAIKAGGSTLKDFAAVDGALGYFQHSFKVYDHKGDACPDITCTGTISRIKQSGRSSFYCETCQR